MGNTCTMESYSEDQERVISDRNRVIQAVASEPQAQVVEIFPQVDPDLQNLRTRINRASSIVDWGLIDLKYELLNTIQSSGNTNVCLYNDISTNQPYVVKILLQGYNSYILKDQIALSIPDIELPFNLDCPYILNVKQAAVDRRCIMIISEFCVGGTLEAKIRSKTFLKEKEAMRIMYMLLYGVNHMHKKGYIHRDLAPRNILFETANKSSIIKIIDFDVSKKICTGRYSRLGDEHCFHYLAPELIKYLIESKLARALSIKPERMGGKNLIMKRRRSTCKHDEKVDIWSCGVILYQMLCGELPFKTPTEIYKGKLTVSGGVWNNISKNCIDLLISMLKQEPEDRLCAEILLSSPCFKDLSGEFRRSCSYRLNLDSLARLEHRNSFQMIILTHISSTITKYIHWRKLHKTFTQMDTNNDGTLSKEELQNAFKMQDIAIPNIDALFNTLDADGNGKIEYSEFQAAYTKMSDVPEEYLKSVFDEYDKDQNGTIDLHELKSIFQDQDSKFIKKTEKLMEDIDRNGDRKIDFEEFKDYLGKLSSEVAKTY